MALLVMLDLSKCFDVIDHAKLLDKLRRHMYLHVGLRVTSQTIVSRWRCRLVPPAVDCLVCCPTPSVPIKDRPSGHYCTPFLAMICHFEDAELIQYADDTQVLVTGPKRDMTQKSEHS